jgi:cytochrome c oxidase subunit I
MVLATPVLAITLFLVAAERIWKVGVFNPALGGDPLLFQHLFWFYSHPAVYIMILPGMGVVSELIAAYSRKRVFGYTFVALSSVAIGLIGFLVWGHHMFVAGQSPYGAMAFSFLSYLVSVPSAIKVFNWTATLRKGRIRLDTPLLYAIGFIGLFTVGGMTGLMLAAMGIDMHVHDVLRNRSFPLHHGWWHGNGLYGRVTLLVAEDQWAALPGVYRQDRRNCDIHRI